MPRSIEASSFPRLQTIAPGPPGFSKSYQDHHHKAEWLALQPMKLPKTPGHSSSKARSRPKVGGPQPQGSHGQELACTALPTSLLLLSVLEEACLSIWCQRCRPLSEGISLRVPTFETGFDGSFFPWRIPEPQHSSSMSSTHRSHLASHSDPGSVCLSLQCSRSRTNASLIWGLPIGMFRSIGGSFRPG